MVAQDGGQHGWSLLLGGAVLGIALSAADTLSACAAAAAPSTVWPTDGNQLLRMSVYSCTFTYASLLHRLPAGVWRYDDNAPFDPSTITTYGAHLTPRCRQSRRQQASYAAAEQSADDEDSLAGEDNHGDVASVSASGGLLPDGRQQQHRRSRLMNGHVGNGGDAAYAAADGSLQRNGSPAPTGQQSSTPLKSRRVRLAQVLTVTCFSMLELHCVHMFGSAAELCGQGLGSHCTCTAWNKLSFEHVSQDILHVSSPGSVHAEGLQWQRHQADGGDNSGFCQQLAAGAPPQRLPRCVH
jgi:hypothetical protein